MTDYKIPDWAAVPPNGYHLDVMKDDKLVQKLMIDEKKSYYFGRNPTQTDFCIDHSSCSRVHAVLVYHGDLERAFLIDLGSTHGTFIGHVRLDHFKPTQLLIDSHFRFGASTRKYILRKKPEIKTVRPVMQEIEQSMGETDGGLFGLTEIDTEIANLTEFNTALNKRVSLLGISETDRPKMSKNKNLSVQFNEDEEIINPEDVDPSIGRFRNLVQTTLIPCPSKKSRLDTGLLPQVTHHAQQRQINIVPQINLYEDFKVEAPYFTTFGSTVPNPAPELEPVQIQQEFQNIQPTQHQLSPSYNMSGTFFSSYEHGETEREVSKKKYAKEAWPGRRSAPFNMA